MVLDNTPYGLVMKVLSDEADKVLFFRNGPAARRHFKQW